MRIFSVTSLVLATVSACPAQAALFTCAFIPSNPPASCDDVDSSVLGNCHHDFSPTIKSVCQGGRFSANVTQLFCYFAATNTTIESVAPRAPEEFAKFLSEKPGFRTSATQWITDPTVTVEMSLAYKESTAAAQYVVVCSPK